MGADNQSDKVTLIIADPETHPLAPWSHCAQTIIVQYYSYYLIVFIFHSQPSKGFSDSGTALEDRVHGVHW